MHSFADSDKNELISRWCHLNISKFKGQKFCFLNRWSNKFMIWMLYTTYLIEPRRVGRGIPKRTSLLLQQCLLNEEEWLMSSIYIACSYLYYLSCCATHIAQSQCVKKESRYPLITHCKIDIPHSLHLLLSILH